MLSQMLPVKFHKKIFYEALLFLAATALFFGGCGPRGETRSLDEVLRTEQQSFEQVLSELKGRPDTESFQRLTLPLEKLSSVRNGNYVSAASAEIGEILAAYLPRASFTMRPGMDELIRESAALKTGQTSDSDRQEARLLAARVYSAVTAELRITGGNSATASSATSTGTAGR